jgi:hypothetical protein
MGSELHTARKKQLALAKGIIHELYNCEDASRAWTGNWDDIMIRRVEKKAELGKIVPRHCVALRTILRDLYDIISQGGNDILEVRHTLTECHRQYAARQKILNTRVSGQRSIRDWLITSRGLNGADVTRLDMAERMNTDEDINDSMALDSEEEDIQEISGLPLQVDYVQESWIPKLSLEDESEIETKLHTDNTNQIIMTVDKTVIRATMLQNLLNNYLVSKEVVNAYGRRLQASYTRRLCKFFSTSFFERLFNPNGTYKQQEAAKLNINSCKGYTATINIFEYQLLFYSLRQHN